MASRGRRALIGGLCLPGMPIVKIRRRSAGACIGVIGHTDGMWSPGTTYSSHTVPARSAGTFSTCSTPSSSRSYGLRPPGFEALRSQFPFDHESRPTGPAGHDAHLGGEPSPALATRRRTVRCP